MNQLALLSCLSLALVAGCSKKHEVAAPGPAGPPAGKVAAPHVNDPSLVCRGGEHGRTVYSVELGFPDGCGPIPTEPGGQARDLEITIEGAPPTAYIMDPVDLATRSVAFAAEGCGASITYVGAIGTLELGLAAVERGDNAISGTGRWAPTGGTACDVKISGTFSDYGNDTSGDDEDDEGGDD